MFSTKEKRSKIFCFKELEILSGGPILEQGTAPFRFKKKCLHSAFIIKKN
jgi:hypothetical protein